MPVTLDDILGLNIGKADREVISAELDMNRKACILHQIADIFLRRVCGSGFIVGSTENITVDESTGRMTVPSSDPIVGIIDGRPFEMISSYEASGTAGSGSLITLVDATLAQADGFWIGAYILFGSGTNAGEVREVIGSSSTNGALTWAASLPVAVVAGDTYVVTFYYIQDLTDSVLNYIYARATNRTARDGIVEWVANTTGTVTDGDILCSTVTLDGSGDVTTSDNLPDDHSRILYLGAGVMDQIILTGTVSGLGAGLTSAPITRSHDDLILLGPCDITCDVLDCSGAVTDGWGSNAVTFTITNDTSYTDDITYTITRYGRKRRNP